MQIIADVTGFPVVTIEQEVEAPMGAVTPESAARGWVTLREHARPREAERERYAQMFEIYKSLYPALKPAMHRLRELDPSATNA
jgi:ribulokinase